MRMPARTAALKPPSRRTVLALLGALTAAPLLASPQATAAPAAAPGLDDPAKKEIAMKLVASAENSSLDWKAQYKYIEDIGDGRGYTAGIIGFCSGTGDMLDLVELYTDRKPGNVLAKYLPALRRVNGTDSHDGLDPAFPADWRRAAQDTVFQRAQNDERDRVYFDPAVRQGKANGSAYSASSRTTTPSSCTATGTTRPASATSASGPCARPSRRRRAATR